MKISVVSGGFDPIHSGHIAYLRSAKEISDYLIVALNSDEWLVNKKKKVFMTLEERKNILSNIECVDEVITFNDDAAGSCINALEKIKAKYGRPSVGNSGPQGFLQKPGGRFYDLGSGTGKPCLAAAILHNFEVCIGVEKLRGLYESSLEVLHAYNIKGKSRLPRDFDTEVRYFHGDIFARDVLSLESHNWINGDVVFVNSVCFDDNSFRKLADIAVGMKKGSFFITYSERLPVADFTVVDVSIMMQSWGHAKVYIMQKNTDPRLPDRGSAAGLVIEGEENDRQQ